MKRDWGRKQTLNEKINSCIISKKERRKLTWSTISNWGCWEEKIGWKMFGGQMLNRHHCFQKWIELYHNSQYLVGQEIRDDFEPSYWMTSSTKTSKKMRAKEKIKNGNWKLFSRKATWSEIKEKWTFPWKRNISWE